MKPFLILQLRPEDIASDKEYAAFLRYGGLKESEVVRVRIEKDSIEDIDIDQYSAVLVGGGPANVSDDKHDKPDYQKRFESELALLYRQIVEFDKPFLGICYGLGSLLKYLGGTVSKEKYHERVGSTVIALNREGRTDPLLEGFPATFPAFVGHKEACQNLPEGVVLLASSAKCPIQMVRFKNNIYATQFHCELDAKGLEERIEYYKNYGYFDPAEAIDLIEQIKDIRARDASLLLLRFVVAYRQT